MTNPLEDLVVGIDPAQMSKAKISLDAFIAAHNLGEAVLIDIRVAEETAVWQVNIGLRIPAPELPTRIDELPKDKLLVVACPHTDRSNMARSYLAAQGYNVKAISGNESPDSEWLQVL